MTTNRRILCEEAAVFLSRLQDNELDPVNRARIDAHLQVCETCQKKLLQLKEVTARVKQLPEIETSPSFTARVMGNVLEKEKKFRWLSRLSLPSLSPSLAGVMYSFVFIIFLVIGALLSINYNSSALFFPKNKAGNQSPKQSQKQELFMIQLLVESRDLSLINVQDKTIAMLVDGNGEPHED